MCQKHVRSRQLQLSRTGKAPLLLSHATGSPSYHPGGRRSRRHARNALSVRRSVGFSSSRSLIKSRFWRGMARAVHAIAQKLWRLVVMTALKNHLTSKGSEHTWPFHTAQNCCAGLFAKSYLLCPLVCSWAYAGFRFCLKRLSARTTTAATSNR